ncbi:MAG TPA: dioxygenase [Acidimicrobiales bacterium]|nr:dioxygenase [Acidimicrobiales bacterium]
MTTPIGDHGRQVCASFAAAGDPRLAEVMQAVVRHAHALVEEVALTRDEWLAAIRFLTAVGARCDDVRQEFILLSDTLGVSTLLEMVNAAPAPGASEPTVLGPFYVPGAPLRGFGDSIVTDPATGGTPLVMTGTVRDLGGRPVSGASLDVWQVQPSGRYDIEDDPSKRNLRSRFETGADGRYRFATVRPVDYTIPDDGPVGTMLRATGRHSWRPAHVHFMITADGFKPLVTHLFDGASPWLERDAVFGVRPALAVGMDGDECVYDFVLEAA